MSADLYNLSVYIIHSVKGTGDRLSLCSNRRQPKIMDLQLLEYDSIFLAISWYIMDLLWPTDSWSICLNIYIVLLLQILRACMCVCVCVCVYVCVCVCV